MRTKVTLFLLSYFTVLLVWTDVSKIQAQEIKNLNGEPTQISVKLERMYLDGEVSEEVFTETIWSIDDFWAKYEQWELINMGENQFVFRQHINDISPLLKSNGYFGISNDGTLSIFNGKPEKTNIIQSFFQLDIKKLESKKQNELKKGIPIKTKDNYEEVLQTFQNYSKQKKEAK